MNIETKFLSVAVLAIIASVPISINMQKRSRALLNEEHKSGGLKIQVDSLQKQLEKRQINEDKLRRQNDELEKRLQAKIKRDAWLASLTFSIGSAPAWKVRDALAYYMDTGLSKTASAYLVGNLVAESGLNEAGTGDSGLALGIAQWHPNRRYDMPADFRGQLEFVLIEMRRQTPVAYNLLISAPTASQASQAVYIFEAYGIEGNRFGYAEQILERI